MLLSKEKLFDIESCYCISMIDIHGEKYVIAASEKRGGDTTMMNIATGQISHLHGVGDGFMTIVPIPEDEGAFFVIRKFYPVFASEEAEVAYCRMWEIGADIEVKSRTVFKLPFVHRIVLTGDIGKRAIIASPICGGKDFQDDWSKPADVYIYTLDKDYNVTEQKTLITGIHKNHGIFNLVSDGSEYTFICGDEGIWKIDSAYNCEKICDEPSSDICLFDVDNCGENEILCIAPFHGDHFKILKKAADSWDCISDKALTFGHAIWAGELNGRKIAVTCSRGGDKEITVHYFSTVNEKLCICSEIIDTDMGFSNIAVDMDGNKLIIYCSNIIRGEVDRYTVSVD